MKILMLILCFGLLSPLALAVDDTVKTQAERMAVLRDIFGGLEEAAQENITITPDERQQFIQVINEVGKDYLQHSNTKFKEEAPGVFKLELNGKSYFNALAIKIADLTSITTIKIAPAQMNNLLSWTAYSPKDNSILLGPKTFIEDVPEAAVRDLVFAIIQDKVQKLNTNYKLDPAAFASLYDFATAIKYLSKLETRKNKNLIFKNQADQQFLGNYLMASAYIFLQDLNSSAANSSDPIEMATAGEAGKGFIDFPGKAKSNHFLNLLAEKLLNDEDLEIEQVIYDPQNLHEYFSPNGEYDAKTKTYKLGHHQILNAQSDAKNAKKMESLIEKEIAAIKKKLNLN